MKYFGSPSDLVLSVMYQSYTFVSEISELNFVRGLFVCISYFSLDISPITVFSSSLACYN